MPTLKRKTYRLSDDIAEQLRAAANSQGVTDTEILRRALSDFFAKLASESTAGAMRQAAQNGTVYVHTEVNVGAWSDIHIEAVFTRGKLTRLHCGDKNAIKDYLRSHGSDSIELAFLIGFVPGDPEKEVPIRLDEVLTAKELESITGQLMAKLRGMAGATREGE